MSKGYTVKRTVTLILPREVNDFLERLAGFSDMDVEGMLRSEIMDILTNFYTCGHFEAWTEEAKEYAKKMEDQLKQACR